MVELPLKHSRIFERLGILAPKGVLLYGPPGTGKTLLARAVAAESRVHFIHLNGPEIMRKFYGESEAKLREVFDEAARHAPAVLFIDEIDAVAPKRADVVGDVEKRVVAQLLSLMDGFVSRGQVIVMGATNIPELLDPALRRPGRFDREIEIGVPNTQARLQILRIHTRAMPLAGDVDLAEIAEHSHGFVGADLEALCQEVGMIALRRFLSDTVRLKPDPTTRQPAPTMGPDTVRLKPDPTTTQPDPTTMQPDPTMRPDPAAMSPDPTAMSPDPTTMKPDPTTMKPPPSPVGPGLPAFPLPVGSGFSRTGDDDDTNLDALQVARDDFLTGLKEVEPSATREFFIEKSDTTFASLGGLHEVKQTLAAIVDHSHVHDDIYERAGLAPPRGILLVGPTGTGKTAMARALSGEKQLPLIAIDGPQLYSKWLGESEMALREVFKKARRAAPCILFFDTIDAVAPQAGPDHPGSDVYQRILSQLLREIDNLRDVKGVVLLAATNRPERVDRALLRSGRFDYTVRFAAPNEIDRGAIIRLCCRQVPLEPDVLVDELARSTDGLTGADLESLCKRATLAAIAELRSGRRQAPFAVGRRDFLTALEGMRHG
jgi:transitional endoplasmic reticulum ATPase